VETYISLTTTPITLKLKAVRTAVASTGAMDGALAAVPVMAPIINGDTAWLKAMAIREPVPTPNNTIKMG
jgi:hypothetical protein